MFHSARHSREVKRLNPCKMCVISSSEEKYQVQRAMTATSNCPSSKSIPVCASNSNWKSMRSPNGPRLSFSAESPSETGAPYFSDAASTATTRPSAPTASAKKTVMSPWPHPISSTRMPGCRCQLSARSIRKAIWATCSAGPRANPAINGANSSAERIDALNHFEKLGRSADQWQTRKCS